MPQSQRSMLAVFAHPDDELLHGGTLAHLAREGVHVTILCATRGEAGKLHPSVKAPNGIGALREAELRDACRRLGIEQPVFLDYHDSGRNERFRTDDPRALANADPREVEEHVRRVIDEVRPQVVLTFDPHGGYFHPDHIAIAHATTGAFFYSGILDDTAPQRLFYGATTEDQMRPLMAGNPNFFGDLDIAALAVPPAMIAHTFDATPYLELKQAVQVTHRSQFGLTEDILRNPPPPVQAMLQAFRGVMVKEVFMLGGVRSAVPHWPLQGLFDGLPD